MENIRAGGNAKLANKKQNNTISYSKVSGRSGVVADNRLWFDDKGNRLPIKFIFHYEMPPEKKEVYLGKVKKWTDNTCLKFEEQHTGWPDDRFEEWCYKGKVKGRENRVLNVYDGKGGGASSYGIPGDEHEKCVQYMFLEGPQSGMSLLFAYTLGLIEDFNRPDFEAHMSLHLENFSFGWEENAKPPYLNHVMKCRGKATPLPIPFDFMSVLMMESNWFGTMEGTPVAVTLDPSQQYQLDYHYRAQLSESFFDILSANILYKCIPEWESACKEEGKQVPKCQNYGYVTKGCTCLCAPSYSGTTCEKRIGDNIPYPTQVGVKNVVIIDDKNYDLGELDIKTAFAPGYEDVMKYNVFINILVQPKNPKRLPTIKVFLPFEKVRPLFDEGDVMDHFLYDIEHIDCLTGLRLLWGNSQPNGRRLACECTSMLASNEPVESSRVIRGREPNMTITLVNQLGVEFKKEKLTIESSKFHLLTEFHTSPTKLTSKLNSTSPPLPEGATGGNDTEPVVNSATAAAMTAAGGSGAITAVVAAGAGLVLLFALCLLLFFLKRRKKKKQGELGEEEEEEEDENSGSGSDSNDEK